MSTIKGNDLKLHKVFCSDFEFHIPEYQRPYAWEDEQASELYEDLWTFMEEEGDNEEYFLGSIVLVKNDSQPEADVVDGQQRLTTLTLLLAVIRDRLMDSPDWKGAFDSFVVEPGQKALGLESKPRLFLRERDQPFLEKYIQTEGGLTQLENLKLDRYRNSQLNIARNALSYMERLRQLEDQDVGRLGQFIVKNCILVVVSTSSFNSAYRIFSVMNDRGLELETSDILKANIISGVFSSERAKYTERWEDAEDRLGRKSFNDLFGHIRMIYRKEKARRSLLEEFEEFVVKQVPGSKHLLDQVVLPYADALEIIEGQAFQSATSAKPINDLFGWLYRVNNIDWVPVAMELVRRFGNQPESLEQHLRMLERLAASLFIRGAYVTPRIERYGRVLTALENGQDLLAENSALDLSASEKAETLNRLDGPIYEYSSKLRMYILLRLDSFLAGDGVTYQHRTTTIEHVLPQNPDPASQWVQDWSEADREAWVNRLGNLVLLSRKKNTQAANYDFERKKQEYFRTRHGVSLYASSTQVLGYDRWTVDEVSERQGQLVKHLAKAWNLN